MTELVLRGRHNDQRVVDELLTEPAALGPRRARFIRRVVVDSTAVTHTDQFARTTLDTGTQLLIDPQTTFLATEQDKSDSWARLPFGNHEVVTARALTSAAARVQLIAGVVEFQLDHGATAIIPPYLHLPEPSALEVNLQRRLITETAHHVHVELSLKYDIFPIIVLDQRAISLEMNAWQSGIGKLLRTATTAAAGQPFGLGLSRTSNLTTTSIQRMARVWRRAARVGPFIAWHAGAEGLLAVAMGAQGYETGMCAGERCDIRSEWRNRAPRITVGGPRYTGVYIESLGRSISKSAATQLSKIRPLQGDLACLDSGCCPHGFDSMLGAGRRQHAVRRRLVDLEALDAIGARGWRLHHLERRATDAAASAIRIRRAAEARKIPVGANPAEYEAMEKVVSGLLLTARTAIA